MNELVQKEAIEIINIYKELLQTDIIDELEAHLPQYLIEVCQSEIQIKNDYEERIEMPLNERVEMTVPMLIEAISTFANQMKDEKLIQITNQMKKLL